MRIATWNLMRARPGQGRRTTALRDHMSVVNADVWVLTESHRELAPDSAAPRQDGAGDRDPPPAPRPRPDGHALIASSHQAPDRGPDAGERWVTIWSRIPAEPIALGADPERTAGRCCARRTGERS